MGKFSKPDGCAAVCASPSSPSRLTYALLCRRAGALVGKQAGQSFSSLKEGVQQETEYITKTINNGLGYVQSGPRHVQSVLARLQKRIEETRLQALLEVCRPLSHFPLHMTDCHVACVKSFDADCAVRDDRLYAYRLKEMHLWMSRWDHSLLRRHVRSCAQGFGWL